MPVSMRESMPVSIPMEFICMDLIGEFHPPTSRGHRYALTVMDMLMGFVFCAPLHTKRAKEIVQKYLDTVYYRFGGSRKILSDNGTEFKNKVFENIAKKLGCEVRAQTPIQWKDRMLPQVFESMHGKTYQPKVRMG